MSLLYMDLDPIDAIIQKLNDEFWKLAATKEEQHHQNALALLDDLASRHIYFQQFRLDMNCRLTHAKLFNSYTEDVLPRAYLYHLPEKLRQMQAQILELIQHVLDRIRSPRKRYRRKWSPTTRQQETVPFGSVCSRLALSSSTMKCLHRFWSRRWSMTSLTTTSGSASSGK